MKPGTIFVSHRSEYGGLVRELKTAIETASRGKLQVDISEDLPRAENWRTAIRSLLEDAETLILVYGAPYEDWSWCFYEVGFFVGIDATKKQSRRIYCISRPNVPAPGPLNDLQMVTDKEQLITDLIHIFDMNKIDYDAIKLREAVDHAARGLFRQLNEFEGYPRLYFSANDADFGDRLELPLNSALSGEKILLNQLFGIGKDSASWEEITRDLAVNRPREEQIFLSKWINETKGIILAARKSRFSAPQTVLITRGGMRFRSSSHSR